MLANAAGPVAALHLLHRFAEYAYIGTTAWFFCLINLFKLPFMLQLGIVDAASLGFSAGLMVYAVLGAALAPLLVRHIPQRVFDGLIWVFVIVGGLKLIF